MTTARRRTIKTPMKIPPISPALADSLSPVFSSLGRDLTATVVTSSGFLLVGGLVGGLVVNGLVSGEPTVVVIGGRETSGQSGDLRVSSEVGHEASRCSLEDNWIEIEALLVPTQDCMRETSAGALYTSVPTILALYTIKLELASLPRQLNSSFLMLSTVRRHVGQRCISSTASPLRT